MTKGRPVAIHLLKDSFSNVASSASNPDSTCTPARCSTRNPRPLCFGFGRRAARTTRCTPAAMMASVQGGVLPQVQHVSSVTYSVAFRRVALCRDGSRFQSSSAVISACAVPARLCQPSPMMRPPRTSTAPTAGFGLVLPTPRRASANARRMKRSSWGVNLIGSRVANQFVAAKLFRGRMKHARPRRRHNVSSVEFQRIKAECFLMPTVSMNLLARSAVTLSVLSSVVNSQIALGVEPPSRNARKDFPTEKQITYRDQKSAEHIYLVQEPSERPANPRLLIYMHGAGGLEEQGMDPVWASGTFARLRRLMNQWQWIYVCPRDPEFQDLRKHLQTQYQP